MTPSADAHVHLFAGGYGRAPAGEDELAVYEELRDRHGIRTALVVGYEGEARYAGNNGHVLALAAERDWIAPVAYLSLGPGEAAPTADELADLAAAGAVGFALYLTGAAEGRALASLAQRTLDELNAQDALLSLNATPAGVAAAGEAFAALEGCRLLFSHLGLPGRVTEPLSTAAVRRRLRPLLALASRPNIAVKLSGAYAIGPFPHESAQPFVDCLLDAFGPERLVWGSDFAPALEEVSFAQAASTHLLRGCTSEEIQAVMGDNLTRVLRKE